MPTPDHFSVVFWENNCRGGVGRNVDREAAITLLPVRDDGPIGGVILDVQLRKSSVKVWMDDEVVVAGANCVRIDTSDASVHPGHD